MTPLLPTIKRIFTLFLAFALSYAATLANAHSPLPKPQPFPSHAAALESTITARAAAALSLVKGDEGVNQKDSSYKTIKNITDLGSNNY